MKVKEAMHSGVTWVEPETRITELAKRMRDEDIGSIPVGEDDRLVGMVTDRDLAIKALADGHDPQTMTARDVMSGPILFCRTDQDLDDAVSYMESKQVRRLPVIDENKRMVGMLSLGDVAAAGSHKRTGEMAEAVSAHHA
jgi:CBS domain-containing protein